MNRGICRSCGKSVYWVKKPTGGISRLLSYKTNGFTIENGVVNYTLIAIYEYHACDPVDVEAFSNEAARQAILSREYQDKLLEAQVAALKRKCVKCGAKVDEACVNLNQRKVGKVQKTRWPHPERMNNADSTQDES